MALNTKKALMPTPRGIATPKFNSLLLRPFSLASESEIQVYSVSGGDQNIPIGSLCELIDKEYYYAKSLNKETLQFEYKPILGGVKHHIFGDCYRVYLSDKKFVDITDGHSLFKMENNVPMEIRGCDIKNGDKLIINGSEKVDLQKVKRIEKYFEPIMYDISVKDNENFICSNGIIAHNSTLYPSRFSST
jgi:intein/homing endonuclease